MEQINLHKQKLLSLIIASVAFISLLLPWASLGFVGANANGFRGWGILSLAGIIAVVAVSLLGDKTQPFDDTFRKVALGSFAAIALGALLFYIRLSSVGFFDSGFGLWLCLIAGVVGIIWLLGIVKLPNPKKPM